MATIPKDCCGTDIPVLCIASLKRQGLSDNIPRGEWLKPGVGAGAGAGVSA